MRELSRRAVLASLAASAASPALAHGPSRIKVVQTVDVARTPDQVWALVGDFDSIAKWHPAVASSPADHGNGVGSKRTLTLRAPGDPHFDEELVKYDAAAHSYQYRIEKVDPAVLPVNNYTAWFELSPSDSGGTTIEWRAAFYRGYMLNDPPPELNDEASEAAIKAVLRAGLDNIKKLAETAG